MSSFPLLFVEVAIINIFSVYDIDFQSHLNHICESQQVLSDISSRMRSKPNIVQLNTYIGWGQQQAIFYLELYFLLSGHNVGLTYSTW